MSSMATVCPICGQLVPVEGVVNSITGGSSYDIEAALSAHIAAKHPQAN